MRRGTIFLVLFIVVAGVIIGVSQFLRGQPPLEVVVAVDPLVQPWAQSAIDAFNATAPVVNATRRIQVRLTPVDDPVVWLEGRRWTTLDHPAAWIPASSISVRYATENGLPFTLEAPSLARSPLVWGGYASRVAVLAAEAPLDWNAVAQAARAESWQALGGDAGWRFVKVGLPQPNRKMGGLAGLLSAAATFNQTPDLTAEALRGREFRDWLAPVARSLAQTSGDPAVAMASQGASLIELALFPEVQWLVNLNGMTSREPLQLFYPAYQFQLDFPLARWQDAAAPAEMGAAVAALRAWLLSDAQQANAQAFGLRPAAGEPASTADLFAAGARYGILAAPDYGQAVSPPALAEVRGLVQWFGSQR